MDREDAPMFSESSRGHIYAWVAKSVGYSTGTGPGTGRNGAFTAVGTERGCAQHFSDLKLESATAR